MSVPKGKRRQSRFEAQHHYYRLRDEVTQLMLQDFGFSPEKYEEAIEWYRQCHESAENVDDVVARYEKKAESFNKWFIDRECDAVLEMLRTRILAEDASAAACTEAAQNTGSMELSRLLQELSESEKRHAELLRNAVRRLLN